MGGLLSFLTGGSGSKKTPEGKKESEKDKKEVVTALQADADVSEAYTYWKTKKAVELRPTSADGKSASRRDVLHSKMMKSFLDASQPEKAVKLPDGEELNEWVAVHTVQFFEALQRIYATTAEYCTVKSCPSMTAGKAEYYWKDGEKYKKPTRVPAATYIEELFNWVSSEISDPKLFPVEEGAAFPPKFMSRVKDIFRRLFRVYAHIYYHHFEEIRKVGANAHLNSCFKHFIYFSLEFNMIEKSDLAPLQELIDRMRQHDASAGSGGSAVGSPGAPPALKEEA